MSSSDGSCRVAALESWIRAHGGSICEAASVLDADGYRGVFACEVEGRLAFLGLHGKGGP